MAKYFGTNGIRGTIDKLGPELALGVSRAFGEWCGNGKVVVGRDMRLTGEMLRDAVVSGLLSVGCEVVDLGIVSSPTLEFIADKLGADGGVIVTASHNPPEWNALKFVDGKGVAVSKERGEEVERLMESEIEYANWEKFRPVQEYKGANEAHIERVLELANIGKVKEKKPKVVLDCGNATACLVAPELYRRMGCKVVVLNGEMDGRFPGRPSEPTEKNLGELKKRVVGEEADLGIAWDGDGDRVVFVDERGEWIVGDRGFALSAMLALMEGKGKVVTTVATSNVVKDVCEKFGGELVYTKVGAPYISEVMQKEGNVVSAGEEVGGIVWPEMGMAKDGFMAGAKIVEAVCERKMSEWMQELPEYYNAKTKIECKEGDKEKVLEEIGKVAREKKLEVNTLDGVRIDFNDEEWAIVRASGTENYFRVFAEAKSMEKAEKRMDEWAGYVREVME